VGNFTPCRIGVWGVFDGDAFADALVPFVLRRELTARLPEAQIRMFAPYGFLRPTPRDGGEPAEPLGRWSPDRAAAMASGLDCILVAFTDPPPDHDALARAYGTDRADLDALDVRRWFVDRANFAEERCPVLTFGADPVVLAPRLFSADLLAKRIEYLWLMGWYPSEGATVLVEGDAGLLPIVPAVGAALGSLLASEPDVTVVLAEMGSPGDAEFAAALAARLPAGSVYRLPRCAGLEDLAAAIVNCAVFAGSSPRAGLVAQAYGRSSIRLDPAEPPAPGAFERAMKADPAGSHVSALAASADAELDRISGIARTAELARRQKEAPMPERQHPAATEDALGQLQVAHEARSRRLATERMVFANHLHKAEAEIGHLKDEVARLREELARADGRAAQAEAATRAEAEARLAVEEELAGLRATRTFRYTAELRSVYGRLRKLGDGSAPAAEPPPPGETKPGR
jgi:HAMP domain-containing protein